MRQLDELARDLDARGPAPDDHERHQASPGRVVGLRLRELEGAEDLAAQCQRVVERLERERVGAELVVTEVGGRGAAGHDEAVVADRQRLPELVDVHHPGVDVDVLYLAQDDAHGPVVAQHVPDGGCDLALRKDPRGHLVQQWLEKVVVGAVDDGDADRLSPECLDGEEPAEAAADDDDMVRTAGPAAVPAPAHRSRSTTVSTYAASGMDRTSSRVNHPTASVVPSTSGLSSPSQAATR